MQVFRPGSTGKKMNNVNEERGRQGEICGLKNRHQQDHMLALVMSVRFQVD